MSGMHTNACVHEHIHACVRMHTHNCIISDKLFSEIKIPQLLPTSNTQ